MGVVYQQGQELDETDLKVIFTDRLGDALSLLVRYSIYYEDTDGWVSLEDQYRQDPEEESTGKYWVDWEIPVGQTLGCYQIRWDFRKTTSNPWAQKRINFQIVIYPTNTIRTAELTDITGTPIVIIM